MRSSKKSLRQPQRRFLNPEGGGGVPSEGVGIERCTLPEVAPSRTREYDPRELTYGEAVVLSARSYHTIPSFSFACECNEGGINDDDDAPAYMIRVSSPTENREQLLR